MQLFFKRDQGTNIFNRPIFKLHAQVQLTNEEAEMVKHYKLKSGKLYHVPQPELAKTCLTLGMQIFTLTFICVFLLAIADFGLAAFSSQLLPNVISICIAWAIGLAAAASFLLYHFTRESIHVTDLINGRSFKCNSVMDLIAVEQHLKNATAALAHVIENSALWRGRQQQHIPVFDEQTLKDIRLRIQ